MNASDCVCVRERERERERERVCACTKRIEHVQVKRCSCVLDDACEKNSSTYTTDIHTTNVQFIHLRGYMNRHILTVMDEQIDLLMQFHGTFPLLQLCHQPEDNILLLARGCAKRCLQVHHVVGKASL